MGYVSQVITWMNANPNIAGWAQAFGAMIGIGIAIAVPWYQRKVQLADVRIVQLKAQVVHQVAVFYLLVEIEMYLRGFLRPGDTPRRHLAQDGRYVDLVQRISALDGRETDITRASYLFRARGMLLNVHMAACSDLLRDKPLELGEQSHLTAQLEDLKKFVTFVQQQLIETDIEVKLVQVAWFLKPLKRRQLRSSSAAAGTK
ncbi:MAG TPA: hypothetical protein VIM12_06205 [Noviherbaspirillum sp.]|jgi:hypothetical protein|uniref:hypothetical protein n=1 Tax=Noviherbaspirillum sp. TaxID=1926288 RepID=UPI002F924644